MALILVVDDDEDVLKTIQISLTKNGYQVIAENNGFQALQTARREKPNLVILDISMPDMDGIQAAKILTEEKVAPVLLLTAYSQRDLIDRAKEAGVVGYLVKPFREQEIVPAIEIALERFKEFAEIEKEIGNLRETLETRKLVDRAKGVLMDKQGLTEAEAFRKIQKMSMNTRKPMKEIAEAIILAEQTKS